MNKSLLSAISVIVIFICNSFGTAVAAEQQAVKQHPSLVITAQDVVDMRSEIARDGRFKKEFQDKKSQLDSKLALPKQVPVPRDSGGGFTHEVHKNNAQSMYDAAIIYQLTGEAKYANYVRDMLFLYLGTT